jgi:hypothetical protein
MSGPTFIRRNVAGTAACEPLQGGYCRGDAERYDPAGAEGLPRTEACAAPQPRLGAATRQGVAWGRRFKNGEGLRIWQRTGAGLAEWRQVAEDKDYGGKDSYGAAFDNKGALYTVADDSRPGSWRPFRRRASRRRTHHLHALNVEIEKKRKCQKANRRAHPRRAVAKRARRGGRLP